MNEATVRRRSWQINIPDPPSPEAGVRWETETGTASSEPGSIFEGSQPIDRQPCNEEEIAPVVLVCYQLDKLRKLNPSPWLRERRRILNAEKLQRGESTLRRLWYHWAFEIGDWRYEIRKVGGEAVFGGGVLIDRENDEEPCYRDVVGMTHLNHEQLVVKGNYHDMQLLINILLGASTENSLCVGMEASDGGRYPYHLLETIARTLSVGFTKRLFADAATEICHDRSRKPYAWVRDYMLYQWY